MNAAESYKKVDQFQFVKKYEWKTNDQLRKRVVKYIKPTGLNYVNKYRRERKWMQARSASCQNLQKLQSSL